MGELTWHTQKCDQGCGLYLLLSNHKVLLMDGAQTCTYPSPSVNQYEVTHSDSHLCAQEKVKLALRIY